LQLNHTVLEPWEDVRSETWAMFEEFERSGKIPRMSEDCISECAMGIDCGTCGGLQHCIYCWAEGKYVRGMT